MRAEGEGWRLRGRMQGRPLPPLPLPALWETVGGTPQACTLTMKNTVMSLLTV